MATGPSFTKLTMTAISKSPISTRRLPAASSSVKVQSSPPFPPKQRKVCASLGTRCRGTGMNSPGVLLALANTQQRLVKTNKNMEYLRIFEEQSSVLTRRQTRRKNLVSLCPAHPNSLKSNLQTSLMIARQSTWPKKAFSYLR